MANATNTSSQTMSVQIQDELDYAFIQRVQQEVTQSCALPFALPAERIPEFILQAAQYFWWNSDYASEERYYIIPNSEVHKCNAFNKIVQLPSQVIGVHGVYKIDQGLKYGAVGDFSLERMMMSTYSIFGGAGSIGGGMGNPTNGGTGYSLSDVVVSMYEVDTFNQTLNAPLSYNYNTYSSKLVLLGDLGSSDVLICTTLRCKIQDLYNDYYFFRYVVCLAKRALGTIYGMYEFKLPGGVTINYSSLSDDAKDEMDSIKEWLENNRAVDYFFCSNTL
jgi:hypothetical protein